MKWIWVRHGETDANRERRYIGHTDILLNEQGKQQAQRAAEQLASSSVTRIYTSDLVRCMDTAEPIGRRCGIQPIPIQALRELNFGDWEGMTYEEIMRDDAVKAEQWYSNPLHASPPGGEALTEMGARIDAWMEQEMAGILPHETIVVISHGGPIRWFRSRWAERDRQQFWQTSSVSTGGMLTAYWDGESFELEAQS